MFELKIKQEMCWCYWSMKICDGHYNQRDITYDLQFLSLFMYNHTCSSKKLFVYLRAEELKDCIYKGKFVSVPEFWLWFSKTHVTGITNVMPVTFFGGKFWYVFITYDRFCNYVQIWLINRNMSLWFSHSYMHKK